MAALKLEIAFDDEFQNKVKKAVQEFLDEKMTEIEKSIRAECADRAAVLYCADRCDSTAAGNENCRHGGGCKEMHKYRAAIEGGQNA